RFGHGLRGACAHARDARWLVRAPDPRLGGRHPARLRPDRRPPLSARRVDERTLANEALTVRLWRRVMLCLPQGASVRPATRLARALTRGRSNTVDREGVDLVAGVPAAATDLPASGEPGLEARRADFRRDAPTRQRSTTAC